MKKVAPGDRAAGDGDAGAEAGPVPTAAEARLAQALRANLRRRKQAHAPGSQGPGRSGGGADEGQS